MASCISAPTAPTRTVPEVPEAKFTDITAASGVNFVHYSGAYGDKLLPETMGGGVAFFDFDNDGDADLLFINGTDWPWAPKKPAKPTTMVLYRNDGKGRFEDATAGSGLDVSFYGMSPAVGDFDNDGASDLAEFRAGTNPSSDTSTLRILRLSTALAQDPSSSRTTVVLWSASPGKAYRVQRKAQVDDPWADVGPVVTAGSTSASFTDTVEVVICCAISAMRLD